ncbi:hypothetical protein P8831_09890 [Priestia megaterium]|uniref:hypothetical protein n=1 Tax=Priestia megaterium TaxID=1404 RepID=UPI002D7F4D7F|nr:hypothetical protein [Priestia megaterium]MEB4869026.1 hypothetical protein [Priestia megaterium]
MDFSNESYKETVLKGADKINIKTMENYDLSDLLEIIDINFEILFKIKLINEDVSKLWNDVLFDVMSSVYSATSGFYRQAQITLRSVLELGCMSFFYLDKESEFISYKEYEGKTKTPTSLVNQDGFFTTDYIRRNFYSDIDSIQKCIDSVSEYIKKIYSELCLTVHGRYNKLNRQEELPLRYNQDLLEEFIKNLNAVMSIFATMYILRTADMSIEKLVSLAKSSETIEI